MTISHRLLDEDELAQATVEELYCALGAGDTPRLLGNAYRVDTEHDIPNGGGSSIDRRTVYIDRTLYHECMDGEFRASGLTPQQIIDRWCDHEHAEVCIIEGDNPVDTYVPAHERALRLEHEGVLAILGRDGAEGKIRTYEETIWPALLQCYHRPIKKAPRDLWCGPNLDEPTERDKEVLASLKKLGVADAGKQSKYGSRYGMAEHRCHKCLHWSPQHMSQEHGEIAACSKVSGLVRYNRGCSLFEPSVRQGRPVPGGPAVRAPDGHYYVHKPHDKGHYHRVVVNG